MQWCDRNIDPYIILQCTSGFHLFILVYRHVQHGTVRNIGPIIGVSKTNWDIGISLILALNLGYWPAEIGILGYQ